MPRDQAAFGEAASPQTHAAGFEIQCPSTVMIARGPSPFSSALLHAIDGWLDALLALDWKRAEDADAAAGSLARCSGDRARDPATELRERVADRLKALQAPVRCGSSACTAWSRSTKPDARGAFGEALPSGLRLLG